MMDIEFPNLNSLKTIVEEANKIANTILTDYEFQIFDEGCWFYCKLLDINLNEGYVKVFYSTKQEIMPIDKFMKNAKSYV
jgi:hypothetical protein